ncbi:uncharacterized protein LOC105159233 isoform X1 [Sesamum indicum]|uniref:Uncharacterized protein LOC105159233 isoform X1 n=1 Tax=Sesamum indicum TaxID=4182 RepID=A0A6I9SY65_SESIN|nr:uncharacterized protein LOC105159233 isoform X1 [Sesamum indicum]
MELRGCGNTHFIQIIRGDLVIKGYNTDSHGRPALSFKTIKEIYEGKESVKYEVPCFPVAQRTLREIKHEIDEFVSDPDNGLDSDLDDETTLRQLKQRFLKRKRKVTSRDQNSNLAYANQKTLQAESDLNEPIINWKSKNSRKLKAKKNCMKGTVVSSLTTAFDIKSETNLVEGLPQVGPDLALVIRVKVEVPDANELGCKRKTSAAADASMGQNEVASPGGEASNGFQKTMAQLELREPLYSAEECLKCVTNEISYEHLEDNEPISELDPSDGMTGKLETPELFCDESLDLAFLEIEKGKEIRDKNSCRRSLSDDQSSDVCMPSRSYSSMEEISAQGSSSGVPVPRKVIGCNIGCTEDKLMTDEQHNCLSAPEKICSSSQKSITSLRIDDNLAPTNDNIADAEESLTSTLIDLKKNGLNSRSNMENELLKAVEKQGSASSITETKSQSSREHQTSDSADKILTPESRQPPERLLSTRKAISPSSQEQLCLAMNSVELSDGVDQHIGSECKGQLFDRQTEKKSSLVRPEFHRTRLTIKHGGQGQVGQRKVIISSRDIIKKSKNAKVDLESPRFSRTLPNLSAGCTSIQGCSESAIAFSQRQMQDMESLAVKLMNELKSMKDIVEQKLLFEAYRSASLRSDADEVKSAINSASRMEETARKWLSMMQRDCNRFCKIMKLTPNGVAASNDAGPRERKKIIFADEAGGKLCHVKLFEDGITSPLSDGVQQ